MGRLKSWWPLFASALFYGILLGIELVRIYSRTHGKQIYLLDDTYIHLSMARNLLLHGTYGVSATEPSMSASSILWPLLLAGVGKVVGLTLLLPLVLNIVFALALLAISLHVLRRNGITSLWWQTGTLVLLVLSFPLVSISLDGMEHVLFGLAFILFLWVAGETVGESSAGGQMKPYWLPICALLLTSCRYEGGFAVCIACLLLARRRLLLAVITAVAGLLPMALFGIYSRQHGGMWVPNSLLMKTHEAHPILNKLTAIPRAWIEIPIWKYGLAGVLLLLVLLTFGMRRNVFNSAQRTMLLVFLGTAALHLEFVLLNSFTQRYETYLIGGGVLLAAICIATLQDRRREKGQTIPIAVTVLAVFALVPLTLYRGVWTLVVIPNGADSIYEQQYQAAQFFSRYYYDQPIVANDVGLVSYYANAHCLDLWGLGNNEVTRRVMNGTFDTAVIERMARERGVKVGFLYADSFTGAEQLPKDWIRVAQWTIPSRRGNTTAGETIYFYATNENSAMSLLDNLRQYRESLPAEVAFIPDEAPIS